LDAEVTAVVFDSTPGSLIFTHPVQSPRRSHLCEQGRAAAAVVDRDFGAARLAGMVNELDGAPGHIRDFGPSRRDNLNRGIVVFDDAVRGDERVDDHEADSVRAHR
jgi:hypothetical protein